MKRRNYRAHQRRKPDPCNFGWRSYGDDTMARSAARTYIARCREDFRPNDFYILTQTEGGEPRHYPVLIVRDREARELHIKRSGFRVV